MKSRSESDLSQPESDEESYTLVNEVHVHTASLYKHNSWQGQVVCRNKVRKSEPLHCADWHNNVILISQEDKKGDQEPEQVYIIKYSKYSIHMSW